MAGRIRTLKPELLEDPKTAGLSHAGFRLFVGAILLADDHGRLRCDPRYLSGAIFWSCGTNVEEALEELRASGLLTLYSVRSDVYAEIRNWAKHQKVNHPSQPRIPSSSDSEAISLGGETLQNPPRNSECSSSRARALSPTSDHGPPTKDQIPLNPPLELLPALHGGSAPRPPDRRRAKNQTQSTPKAEDRYAQALADGVARVTGACAPSNRGKRELGRAAATHAKRHDGTAIEGEDLLVWFRKGGEAYARARLSKAEFEDGFSPHRFVVWLNAGRPIAQAGPRGVTPADDYLPRPAELDRQREARRAAAAGGENV